MGNGRCTRLNQIPFQQRPVASLPHSGSPLQHAKAQGQQFHIITRVATPHSARSAKYVQSGLNSANNASVAGASRRSSCRSSAEGRECASPRAVCPPDLKAAWTAAPSTPEAPVSHGVDWYFVSSIARLSESSYEERLGACLPVIMTRISSTSDW